MKILLNLCCAASFACVIAFAVGDVEPSLPGAVVTKTAGSPELALSSHVRSKVVQYFDTYRTDPFGLPADCAARMKTSTIPVSWSGPGVSGGMTIGENQRAALVDAPKELVRSLPARQMPVRYFLAGSNLVAVDSGYKVVDAIYLPTVRLPEGEMAMASMESVQFVRHAQRHGR